MVNDFGKYNESIRLSYNQAQRMYVHLNNIINTYLEMTDPDDMTYEVYRDSIIKKYEMLEDLTWKLLAKIFKASGLNVNNPRQTYKQAFKEGWIADIEIWNKILEARNATAHIYNEEDYEQVKTMIIEQFIGAIGQLLETIGERVR